MKKFAFAAFISIVFLFLSGFTIPERKTTNDLFVSLTHQSGCIQKVYISDSWRYFQHYNAFDLHDIRQPERSTTVISGSYMLIPATDQQVSAYATPVNQLEAQNSLAKLIQEDGTIVKQPAICKP
jgi:hypothetical protein